MWRAFNSLPAGLEELYDAIQSSLDRGQRQTASKLYQLVFEWKRVWSSHVDATYIWLAVNFQDTEALVYPSAAEEAGIVQVLARLLAGTTRGLLQLSSSSSSSSSSSLSTRQVELLHRTVYDWMRIEENWSTIISGEPGGFNPILCLIAVLVCHLQSGRMNTNAGKLEATLYQMFRWANLVENTAENRARLMKILDKLDPLHNASLRVGSRVVPADCGGYWPGHEFLAAFWACKPHLQASFEIDIPGFSPPSWLSRLSNATKRKFLPHTADSERDWLLVAAAHGADIDFKTSMNASNFSQSAPSRRLDTVAFLLRVGLDPNSPMVKGHLKELSHSSPPKRASSSVKKVVPVTEIKVCGAQYRYILSQLLYNNGKLDLEGMIAEYLPLVKASRQADEFPEFSS